MTRLATSCVLLALVPACIDKESLGEPETSDQDESEPGTSTSTSDGQTNTSTPDTDGLSMTATMASVAESGGTFPSTPDYVGCGLPPLGELGPDEAYYEVFLVCGGGCEIRMIGRDPLDLPDLEVGNCLCASINCGECCRHGAGSGPNEPPSGAADTSAGNVCEFEPEPFDGDGTYYAECQCEECDVRWDDVSPSAGLELYEERCSCLCAQAGCGAFDGIGHSSSGTGGSSSSGG